MCENLGTGSSPRIVHWHAGQWQPHKASSPESLLQAVRDAYEPSPLSSKPLAAPSEQTDPVAKLRKLADETDSEAIVEAAVRGIDSPSEDVKELACGLLERAFSSAVDEPMDGRTPYGRELAYRIFVHRWSGHDYSRARAALVQALAQGGKHCWHMQLATMIAHYPESVTDSQLVMRRYVDEMQSLLQLPAIDLGPSESYGFCLFSLFAHSFYYEADLRLNADLFFRVASKAYPFLLRPPTLNGSISAPPAQRQCGGRVRLGIASACFATSSHPVPSDFGGVLARLPSDVFDVTYIHFSDHGRADAAEYDSGYLRELGVTDFVYITMEGDDWLETARQRIAALGLDLLLYLDLTMSALATQVAMVRLAAVTAVSHGHPVTSGIPRSEMDYYISWAAAELPTAQEHYTEELALLPAHTMHQYYSSRVTPEGLSAVDMGGFRHLQRRDFEIPSDARWYLCMQKPHKLTPTFDEMLADVHRSDPGGVIILHEIQFKGHGAVSSHNKDTYVQRLQRAGADLSRVYFLKQQPHHRLLALYSLADVVLDSYYAGGCTTTREALELGALVVTLPAKYLGSRWSLAYYSIMGVTELVARDKLHYVEIAVRMATDAAAAAAVRQRVLENVHKLFHREEAVEAWSSLLQRLAKPATGNCTNGAKEEL